MKTLEEMIKEKRALKSSNFRFLKALGTSGTFGPVFKVSCDLNEGKLYALRIAPQRKSSDIGKLQKEVLMQMHWKQENLIKIYSCWNEFPEEWYFRMSLFSHADVDAEHSMILMEYCDGGTLREWVDQPHDIPLEIVNNILIGICKGLQYIHQHNSIHRNLKPENIFLFRGGENGNTVIPKIGDFGLMTYFNEPIKDGAQGTSYYMSPEKACGKLYGPPSDIFALGVIYYQMIESVEKRYLTGRLGLDEISYGILPQEILIDYPKEASLINQMLAYKAGERPTAKGIIELINSPPEVCLPAPDYESRFKREYKDIKRLPASFYNTEDSGTCTYVATSQNGNSDNTINATATKPFAIKLIELSQYNEKVQARSIVSTLNAINHRNIMKYYDSWMEHPKNQRNRWEYPDYESKDENSKYIFIKVEYCDAGTLLNWLNEPKANEYIALIEAKDFFRQITEGLVNVHSYNIIHRSLKPDSIYLATNGDDIDGRKCVKIGSFQSARRTAKYMTLKGKANPYQCPETHTSYDLKYDVYSLGVIFYSMLLSALNIPNYYTTYILPLVSKPPKFPQNIEKNYPHEKELIEFMLMKDQEVRFSAKQVQNWIQRHYGESNANDTENEAQMENANDNNGNGN